ncbi:MAG: hypothetical protein WBC06_09130 [Chitinophagaceae bacterium]
MSQKPKTKKEAQQEFLSDTRKVSKVRGWINDPDFEEYLHFVLTYMHPYCNEAKPSEVPHIEMQRVGAIFGSAKLIHLIKSAAFYSQDDQEDHDREFRRPPIK